MLRLLPLKCITRSNHKSLFQRANIFTLSENKTNCNHLSHSVFIRFLKVVQIVSRFTKFGDSHRYSVRSPAFKVRACLETRFQPAYNE